MNALIRRRPYAVFFALLIAAACSGAPGRAPETPAPVPADSGPQRPAGTLSPAELEAIYRARADSARTRYTAADVAFMSGMIHHHAQAIVMARLVPTNTDNASIGVLAARIINAQRDEIARMQQWLRDRGQPVPELHITDDHVMVMDAAHDAHMPGLLTAVQLDRLAAARGAEFDRLFLEYMIQHHAGAVTMVHELFATDGAAQDDAVFKLASDVQVDQATEIARMEQMLSAMRARDGGF